MEIIYWIAGTGFLLSAMALDSESMIPAWICAGCAALLAGAAAGRLIGEKVEKLHRCNRKEDINEPGTDEERPGERGCICNVREDWR